MIAVILLVSAAAVLIALLCIRFALLAEIEEDYREIGVMKALGSAFPAYGVFIWPNMPFSRIGLHGRLSSFLSLPAYAPCKYKAGNGGER